MHTRLEVLGWTIDTVAMTISLPPAKLVQLRKLLERWPADRRIASVSELRSLVGRLLHVCEVVRPGFCFVRRILNQLGLSSVPAGADEPRGLKGRRRARIRLGHEFASGTSSTTTCRSGVCWQIRRWARGGRYTRRPTAEFLFATPRTHAHQRRVGGAMGGFCLETGRWWRIISTSTPGAAFVSDCSSRAICLLMYWNFSPW